MVSCRRWRRQRETLQKDLLRIGIAWRAVADRKWVVTLFGNTKAIPALLSFLETTKVGLREGATERLAAWGNIQDREGEDDAEMGEEN